MEYVQLNNGIKMPMLGYTKRLLKPWSSQPLPQQHTKGRAKERHSPCEDTPLRPHHSDQNTAHQGGGQRDHPVPAQTRVDS